MCSQCAEFDMRAARPASSSSHVELGNSRVDHKKEINRHALTSLQTLLPGIAAVRRCSRDFAGALDFTPGRPGRASPP